MKEALRKFSDKQSQRSYSARSYQNKNNTSVGKQFENRDEAIERYRQFLHENQKYFARDSSNVESPNDDDISSEWEFSKDDQTPTTSNMSSNKKSSSNLQQYQPKPPKNEKPSSLRILKHHRFSRRMSR